METLTFKRRSPRIYGRNDTGFCLAKIKFYIQKKFFEIGYAGIQYNNREGILPQYRQRYIRRYCTGDGECGTGQIALDLIPYG